jgi:type VI secretion system protein ImpE
VSKLDRRPSFFPQTPPYVESYFAAWKKVLDKKVEEAEELLASPSARSSVVSGTVDGKSFAGFKDTDSFLSPFLEAIMHERYLWIPFGAIRELSISSPKTLFDLLWIPARVTTWEGLGVGCYLPVLYPDSSLHEDERIKLGRMTDWVSLGGPFSKGLGQHVYQVGEEEKALLEMREVLFQFSGSEEKP